MLEAVSINEGQDVKGMYTAEAGKHFTSVKDKKLLPKLLAVVQAKVLKQSIDGTIY